MRPAVVVAGAETDFIVGAAAAAIEGHFVDIRGWKNADGAE